MLLVRSVWFQLNSVLSFESPHSTAQLIPRDEAGRNFPGSHRFPLFSAELIHLFHPHITHPILAGLSPSPPWTHSSKLFPYRIGNPQPQILSLSPFQCSPPSHQEGVRSSVGLGLIQDTVPGPLPHGGSSPAEATSSHGSSNADLPGVGFLQVLHCVVK